MAQPKRVAVYVDGYNLYYGRIRGTTFKWLDVVALFDRLINEHDPNSQVDKVKFFSSPALAKFATNKQASHEAQQNYHRALERKHPSRFVLKLGIHIFDDRGSTMPVFSLGKPYDRSNSVRVWKLEEKQTDVNIALAMYRDARSGLFEELVVCSNDSDITPVLAAIREDFPGITLGVVMPLHPSQPRGQGRRSVSKSLSDLANWTRGHIHDVELAACQLPAIVPTRKKPIRKPAHW